MSKSIVANRIYARSAHGAGEGRIAPEDVAEMAPDLVLVRGCKPPTVKESKDSPLIQVAGMAHIRDDLGQERRDHPLRACVAFEIVQLPKVQTKVNALELVPGDIVVAYNSLIDPLLGNDLGVMPIDAVQFVLEWAKRPEQAPAPRPRRQQRALTAATWDGLEPSSRVAVSFEDVRGFEPNMLVSLTRRDSSQVERVVRVAERPAFEPFERGHSGTVTFVNDVYGAGKLASTSVATGDVFTVCERYDADGFPVSQVGETGVGQVFADLAVKGL